MYIHLFCISARRGAPAPGHLWPSAAAATQPSGAAGAGAGAAAAAAEGDARLPCLDHLSHSSLTYREQNHLFRFIFSISKKSQ